MVATVEDTDLSEAIVRAYKHMAERDADWIEQIWKNVGASGNGSNNQKDSAPTQTGVAQRK